MIRLGKDKTLDNYFIDENGVITDKNGIIQKVYLYRGRPKFKKIPVHRIIMYTFYGYRDTKIWVIHHIDEDKQNNSLNNLVYLTRKEHTRLHHKGKHHPLYGKHHSEESKRKMSLAKRNISEETKQKLSESCKGLHWFNDGVKNYRCKECPEGCIPGRIKSSLVK